MQVLSINVSLPVEIEYNNKTITTGIFKKPIEGRVELSKVNFSGDQQVDLENHGGGHKAVYAFAANQYDYWRDALDKPDLHYGQFGENLTIADLDESILCIGDQLKIGSCILEVTQPRVPCYKLGIALGLKSMPKLFIKHAATGIYFKVLQSGSIATNDSVERIYQQAEQLSVRTLFTAFYDNSVENSIEIMAIAAEIPQLSDEWKKKVLSRLNKN